VTGHPLVLAIQLLDLTAAALCLAAGWRLLWIVPHWRPERDDTGQLKRERSLSLVVYQGRWILGLQVVALAALVMGVSNAWVAHVPGAMCGTGVLQALGPAGRQTLLLRLLTLLLLYGWQVVAGIDDQRPDMPLAPVHGRWLLLVSPLLVLSAWRFHQALGAVASQAPVSCCAALYAQAASSVRFGAAVRIFPESWAAACFGGVLPILAWGAFQWRRPGRVGPLAAGLAGGVILLWIITAGMAVKTTTGAYLLEILHHPCPWCLFLWDHGGAGFALFGLPVFMAAECVAALTAAVVARRHPPSAVPALARMGRSGARIALAVLLFAFLAAAPMLLWRLRSGAWIGL
jgi:hypothetical protein